MQRCHLVVEKKKEIVAKRAEPSSITAWGPGARLRAPDGVEGVKPPKAHGF